MDEIFNEQNEVKTSAIKFGKIGDWFKGTLVGNDRQVPNKLSAEKEMQTIYEFKIHGGEFHNIVNNVPVADTTVLKEGDFWSYFAKPAIQAQMRNAKLGQIVGMRFVEERPNSTAGLNATKVIKVYLGGMDPNYHGEQAGDLAV
jgi:hypothetical protein